MKSKNKFSSVTQKSKSSLKIIALFLHFVIVQNFASYALPETSQSIIATALSKNIDNEYKAKEIYLKGYDLLLTDKYATEELGKFLITFGEEKSLKKGRIFGYTLLGTTYRINNQFEKAKAMQQKSIEILEELNNPDVIFSINQIRFEIGVIESELSNLQAADSIFTSLLPFFDEANLDQLSLAYIELSQVRLRQKNYKSFDTLSVQALSYAKQSELDYRITSALSNIAHGHQQKKEYTKAKEIYEKLLNDYPEADLSDKSSWLYDLGEVSFNLNEKESAVKNFHDALEGHIDAGYYSRNIKIFTRLAEIALEENNSNLAKKYITQAESYVTQSKNSLHVGSILYLKALSSLHSNDIQSAKMHCKQAIQSSASFNSSIIIDQIHLLGKILEAEGQTEYAEKAFTMSKVLDQKFIYEYPLIIDFSEMNFLFDSKAKEYTKYAILLGVFTLLGLFIVRYQRQKAITSIIDSTPQTRNTQISTPKTEDNLAESIQKNIVEKKAYLKSELPIADASKLVNTNSRTLSKSIRTIYGVSYSQFINSLRIEEVIKILEDDKKLKIDELMEMSGLNNRTTFTKLFKQRTGTTLTEYKKQL